MSCSKAMAAREEQYSEEEARCFLKQNNHNEQL
jgi:hypothetical protein